MSPTYAVVAVAPPLAVVLVALRFRVWVPSPRRLPPAARPAGPLGTRRWGRSPWRRPHPPGDLDVAAWCERVGAGLRSGRSLTTAVVDADTDAAGARPFADVVHAVRRGRGLGAAFRAVADDPSTATGLAAPVLATCAELGGATAGAIDGVGDVLTARADERAERLAASAQARLSARVLTTVPVAVAALLVATEPSVRHAVTTEAGLACVGAGAVLNLTGWCWMRQMIRGAS